LQRSTAGRRSVRSAAALLGGRRLAIEPLESRVLLAATTVVGLRYEFDASSTPFTGPAVTSLVAGGSYTLNAYIRDSRDAADATGVQQAFFDVDYTGSVASIPSGSVVSHGAYADGASGDLSTAGVINEVGGSTNTYPPTPATGEFPFFSVPIKINSNSAGALLSIVTSLDSNPGDIVELVDAPGSGEPLSAIEVDGLTPSPAALSADGNTITGTIQVSAGTTTATTVTTSNPSVTYGASVTLTAAVSSGSTAPTAGSVDFFDTTAGRDLGTGNFAGSAGTTSTWTLATGAKAFNVTTGDIITATYSPGTGFASSSGTTTQTVNKAGLTITAAANTKTYDGTTTAGATPTAAGLVSGDTVTGLSETYDTKNAGSGKTLTVAGYTVNDGNNGGNYTVTTATNTAGAINKAGLTITAAANTKTYDGNTTAAATPTAAGLVGGDTVTGLSETYDTKNAGTGKTLTVAGYTVNDGSSGGNYTVTTATNTAGVINKAGLTITAAANTKTYDGNTSAAAAPTVAGLVGGDTVTGLSETYDTKNVGTGKTLTVAGYVVNDGNSGGNYTVTTATSTAGAINKAGLTITAAANTKTYDATATAAATPTVAGLMTGDTVTGLSETYNNKNVGTGKTLTVAAGYVVNDGNSGGNYTVTTATNTAGVINKAGLTIAAAANTKIYDATTTAAATPTVAGLMTGDTVTGLSETYDTKNVGSGKTLTVAAYVVNDGNSGGNYTVTTATSTAGVISQAGLTITAATNTKTYDATTTAGATPTVSGLQGSDTVTGLVEAYADANAGTGKTLQVSGYTVNDNNSGGNYSISLANNSTGAINKANAAINVTGYAVPYDANPHMATGTATGVGGVNLGSDLDLSGTTHTAVATYSDTWTFTDPTGNYNNTSGPVTDIINQPSAVGTTTTVTSSQPSATYGTAITFTAIVTATAGTPTGSVDFKDTSPGGQDFGNGTEVSSNGTTATWTLTTGVKAFNYTTGDVVQAAYEGTGNFASSSGTVTQVINKAGLTITAAANTKTYDGTVSAAATPTVAGLVGGDTVTGLSESYDNKNAGSGKTLTVAAGYVVNDGNGGANYTVTTATSTAGVINKAGLTITAAANAKTYDGTTTAAATPTITGGSLVGSDTVTGLSETYDNKNAGTGKTLTVTGYVVNDGDSGGNYTVTTATSTAGVVNKAGLTITAAANTKTYDGNTSAAATPTVAGLQGSDTVTGLSETYDDKNVGTGKTLTVAGYVVNDGNSGANYTVTTATSTAGVINKAGLTITAAANTKTYDGNTSAAATPTVAGLQGSDTVTALSESYDNKNAGSGKTLTVAAGYVVNDGNSGGNYTVTTAASTAGVINKAALTVTAAANTKTYDGTTSAAAAPTITGGSLVGGDTAAFTQSYDNKNVGSGKTLTPVGSVNDGNSGGNYTVTTATSTAGVINKAGLTITAAANTKTYDGSTSAAATPTVAGLQGSDTVTGLSETYDNKNVGSGKTLTVAAGYVVNDGNSGGNYTVTTATSTAGVVNKAGLTITAAANTKTYDGNTSAAATPTVAGLQGSDTVTGLSESYDNKNAGSGKTLTVAAGYVVNDGNSGGNYAVTTTTSTAGVINQVTLTVTAAANTKTYDGTTSAAATPTVTGGSLVGGDTAAFTETYDNKNVGTGKTLTPVGSVNDGNGGADYGVTFDSVATGVINQAGLTITAAANTKTYDGNTSAAATPTVAGLATGDTVTGLSETYDNPDVGTGKTLTVAAGYKVNDGNSGGNYTVTTATNTAGVINAPANAVISGHVYVQTGAGAAQWGIPDVTLALTSPGQPTQTAITDPEGSFSFDSLPAGTYQLTETPPGKYLAATESVGTAGGTTQTNGFSGIVLAASQQATGYDFTSPGLIAADVSLRLFMTSKPSWPQVILGIDDPPSVSLDGSRGVNFSASLPVGGSPVPIVNTSTAAITTADNGALASLTVRIANPRDGSAETLTAKTSVLGSNPPIRSSYNSGVLTLSGIAAAGDYDAVLRTIQYSDTAASPTPGPREITFVANDLIDDSNTALSTVTVLPSDPSAGVNSLTDQVMAGTDNWLGG
jgi:hypothetical protein